MDFVGDFTVFDKILMDNNIVYDYNISIIK